MEEQYSIFEMGLDKYEGTSEATLKKERKKERKTYGGRIWA